MKKLKQIFQKTVCLLTLSSIGKGMIVSKDITPADK